jgi:hypothetical protein
MKIVLFAQSREIRNQLSPALTDEEAAQLTPKKILSRKRKSGTRPHIETKAEMI